VALATTRDAARAASATLRISFCLSSEEVTWWSRAYVSPSVASNHPVCKPYTIDCVIEAKEFDEYFVPALFEPWARDLIRRAQVWKGDSVVDLACGTGIVACRIAGTGARVIGIDASAERLAQAKVRATVEAVHVTWMMRDFSTTTLPPASAMLVTCQHGLQFAGDRLAVVREARRLLGSGGRALFTCWSPVEMQAGHKWIQAAAVKHFGGGYGGGFSFSGEAEMKQLLTDAKFMAVQVETATRLVRFPDPPRFIEQSLRMIADERGVTDEAAITAAIAEATTSLASMIVDDKLEMMTSSVIGIGRVSAK
jgi:ubiquinone/menaquinone biosynthesis C-methylase UbiE